MRKTSFMFWCMIFLVNLMDKHSLFVFGETTNMKATPGQNVSLPCNNGNMNDGNVVRWFAHSAYISTETIIDNTTGLLLPYFAIPGEGYSLFIIIPDDINIWEYLDGDYECRLTSMSGGYSVLSTVTLNIYQSLPICTSLQINNTSSIASCSYNNTSDMESLIWRSNGRTLTTESCSSSNVCTLNYTYNPADIVPHGLTCNVSEPGISPSKSCSINEMSFTTSTEETETDQSFQGSTAGSSSTGTTSNFETSSIRNTPTTTIATKETISTMENTDQSIITKYTDKSTITKLSEESIMPTTSTEFATTYEQNSTENLDFPIHPIAIMSVAFVIILLLIIFIIYYVRRRSQYKQNPSFKSAPPDDHEYVEVDLKVNRTTKGENQEMMENSKESVMEENWIYESADMNGKQITDEQKKEIKNVIVDGDYTNRKTGEQVLEQSALKKSASEKSNEDGTNDGIVYHENEAYQSLDDINIKNDKLDLKESDKKGTKIPAYVHYEVLERE